MGATQLPDEGEIAHGKTVELECDPGYRRSQEDTRRCEYGEWTGDRAEWPTCIGDLCELPAIEGGGLYLGKGGNLRVGHHIPHNTAVNFECPAGEGGGGARVKNSNESLKCQRGKLWPRPPKCLRRSKNP